MIARTIFVVLAGALLAGCFEPRIDLSPESAARVREQDLGTFPYHPLVYHLDLSILSYQLYGQSLVWPFDPYYEDARDRDALMDRVRAWARTTGEAQLAGGAGIDAYRGPGVLGGFEDNPAHDPIVYQYSRLHPWSDTLTNPGESPWVEYRTPSRITRRIREVWVCSRTIGATEAEYRDAAPGSVSLDMIAARRDDADPDAADVLVAFEGGTGDKGIDGQPASQSLMGFALARETSQGYDVHIAFRGSRSGSAARAILQASSSTNAFGNPDWITDLGYDHEHRSDISAAPDHRVARGIATAARSTFPTLFHCLDQLVGVRPTPPAHVYVTGHSLGGGLAQMFTSAVLLGDAYGPAGDRMPASLRGWPWEDVKLVTYGAPRVGNVAWAEVLTTRELESQSFVGDLSSPYDLAATGITDLEILPRLSDAARPVGYRVLIPNDPVTSGRLPGNMAVGQTVYLAQPSIWDTYTPPEPRAHEPVYTREFMLATLRDDRVLASGEPLVPTTAWEYRESSEIEPDRDAAAAGTAAEYERLAEAIRRYYASRDLFFDLAAFDTGAATFLSLLTGG
jgi:hypothetical protein